MKSLNDLVICKPKIDAGGIKQEVTNGFAKVIQKIEIVGLEVVVDEPGGISKGDTVFVKEERLVTQQWAKNVLKLNGESVILVPKAELVAHSPAEYYKETYEDSSFGRPSR